MTWRLRWSVASREVVAKALVRLGACYEKQGNGEARRSYERVVREFADQAEAVQEARAHLSAATSTKTSGLTNHRVWAGPDVLLRARVSRDGRYVAFRQDGNLMLRDLATSESRLIARLIAKIAAKRVGKTSV